MILVIDNYDSFTYNLVQLLETLGAEVRVERNDDVTPEQALELRPRGIVISPGPGMPSDAGMSERIIFAAGEAGIPVFGVCLGHQAIAEVYGGSVVRGLLPVHGKTSAVSHEGGGLMEGMPEDFTATRYHSLVVERETLPECLEITAETSDGVIMGIKHRTRPAFGVQFHPESILTPEGMGIISNFLVLAGEIDAAEATDVAGAIGDTGGDIPQRLSGEAQASRTVPAGVPDGPLTIQQAISAVISGRHMSEEQAAGVMGIIMDGEATGGQIGSLVTALRMKGETVDEVTGFARAMRQRMTIVRPRAEGYIDTCGTGGDELATFNISTTTAFVVAGAGVPIAKHGNRAVSSKSGSADVLEALGVRIDLSAEDMAHCIDEVGVGFLFAQALHSSMRHAGPTRREIAIRTVFNILGPLTNPAGAKRQLLGVYDASLAPVLAEVAGRLGAERVMVVHGHPGMDEVSASGPTTIAEFRDGSVYTWEITPESVGIARGSVAGLSGGDAEHNAEIVVSVLSGEHGPRRDVALMNAAAALMIAGVVEDMAEGVVRARESIDSGSALTRLESLVALTRKLGRQADERKAKEETNA